MSQSNANDYTGLAVAQAGQKTDLRPDVVLSFAAEEAVPFGRALKRGTDVENQCLLVDANDVGFLGIALHQHTVVQTGDTAQYAIGQTVSVLETGECWVEVTSNVTAGAAAHVDVSNGKLTATATSNLAVPGGTFTTSAASGELARLRIK